MFGAAATMQATRAPARTITVLDDLSGWGSTGTLPASPPTPVYSPPGLGDVYPPPAPTAWGFSNVRGMRFSGAGQKQVARTYATPLDFSGANILVPLRTTDPRSNAGSWQGPWRVQFSSDGGVNTLAEYVVQASSADFPVNKPGHWFAIELPTTNVIAAGLPHSTVSRLGVATGKTAPDFSRINWFRVVATGNATNGAGDPGNWDIYVAGLARIERPSEPVITFYFDRFAGDNYQYAIPVFERSLPEYGGDGHYRGWKATFRGDPTDFGVGTNMSLAQVAEMQHNRGHRFGVYGGDFGDRVDWFNPDTGQTDHAVFAEGQNNFGGDPTSAYPIPYDLLEVPELDTIIDGLQGAKDRFLELGAASQRNLLCGQARKLYGDAYTEVVEGMFEFCDMPNGSDHPAWWPPVDPYHVPTRMHLAVPDQANDQAALVTWLDRVLDENQWGRFLLHNVDVDTSVGAGFVMTPAQLERFCQRIEARGIKVRSHDDVMAGRV